MVDLNHLSLNWFSRRISEPSTGSLEPISWGTFLWFTHGSSTNRRGAWRDYPIGGTWMEGVGRWKGGGWIVDDPSDFLKSVKKTTYPYGSKYLLRRYFSPPNCTRSAFQAATWIRRVCYSCDHIEFLSSDFWLWRLAEVGVLTSQVR